MLIFFFLYQGLQFHPRGSMKQAGGGGGGVRDFFLIKKKCKNIS